QELTEFDPLLGERTELVVVTKSDIPEAETVQKNLIQQLNHDVFLISSATGSGLKLLTEAIYKTLNKTKQSW
ncbi:MAG: GTPase ObgE, partial [Planctomycetaceae bacterium]|nr:GTPase ObgE [Planctomycetaceae bacterium]